jgi:ribosomal protein S18 acetylase RimI-like enzyme
MGKTMDDGNFRIRTMSESDLDLVLDWAAAEGWNPGLCDAMSFYAADPEGFLLGEFAGEPIGSISAVAYGESYGFIGLYIVKPEYRGRGYGLRLWNAAMARLENRNVGLDGVIAQQENYRKSGFRIAFRHIRQRGVGGGAEPRGLVELSSAPFEDLVRYDATVFPGQRREFLRRWIAQPGGAALGVGRGDRLAGYGVLRPCREGFKIGPLFADDADIADALFQGLASRAPGAPIFLDTPECNPAAIALAQRRGMVAVFETARMYTREIYRDQIVDRCYGATTLELG